MIRKNAVESILAERDILISVRNPFVVSRPSLHSFVPWVRISYPSLSLMGLFSGAVLLFIYLPWEPVSCDGVSKWRRSVLIIEKFRLLRWRCCSCIYCRSCKCHFPIFLCHSELYMWFMVATLAHYLFLLFIGACFGIFTFSACCSSWFEAR